MTDKIYSIEDTTFDIKEFDMYKFSLPELAMVKGGKEIIRYNFNTKQYTYVALASCFSLMQKGKQNELIYKGLLDLGKYYVKTTINFEEDKAEMSLSADLWYIVKKKLPDDKLINILPESKVVFVNKNKDAYILHFVNCIIAYSKGKEVRIETKRIRYSLDEVLWHEGLVLYKKDSKKIVQLVTPINFNKRRIYYESQDILKSVKLVNDYGTFKFYIVDEVKYLKVGQVDPESVDKSKLSTLILIEIEIVEEYYVSKDFIGDQDFVVKGDMIYQGFEGTLLQKRQYKNKDIDTNFRSNIK